MDSNSTYSNIKSPPIDLKAIEALKAFINTSRLENNWILISPQGVMYKGTPDQLRLIISKEHC